MEMKAGDIVTRDGTDRQRILKVHDDLLEIECIVAPADGWCKVGDRETNLARRYHYPDELLIEREPFP